MTQEHAITTPTDVPGRDGRPPVAPGDVGVAARPRLLDAWLRHLRELPRGVGYLALTGVLVGVVAGFSATVAVLVSGGGDSLAAFLVAVLVLFGALWAARWFGQVELVRLHWATGRPVRPVDWSPRAAPGSGRLGRAVSIFANPHYWLYLLFTVVVFPALGLVTTVLAAAVALGSVGSLAYGAGRLVAATSLLAEGRSAPVVVQGLASLALGLALAVLLPSLVRLLVVVHEKVGHGILGGFRSEQLEVEVAGLEVSRSAAVSAEGTALRRLERDIHDGPQQRLVRLQMDLGAASRALDGDVDLEKGRRLLAEALQQSRDALEELRALSRGFAPPLLVDRGLTAALESLADRATVPTTFRSELPIGFLASAELERNAYFIAAELVTNVAKHAHAGSAELVLASRRAPDGLGTLLEVVVSDDGRGGAGLRDGHGLAGVQERLLGLGGFLDISSPHGGPTVVTVSIPVTAATPGTAGGATPGGGTPAP